jgi:hypothetical protein
MTTDDMRRCSLSSNRLRKRVCFEMTNLSTILPSPSPLDQLEWSEWTTAAWYHTQEIRTFRNECRDLCGQIRAIMENPFMASSIAVPICTLNSMLLAQDAAARGLERKTCPIRRRKKLVATSIILKAASSSRQRHSPDQLAVVAGKCTAWATTLARVQGQCDAVLALDQSVETTHAAIVLILSTATSSSSTTRRPSNTPLSTSPIGRRPSSSSTALMPYTVTNATPEKSSLKRVVTDPLLDDSNTQRLRVA